MNRLWKLLKKEEEEDVPRRQQQALLMSAAAHQVEMMEEDEASQWGGSSEGRKYIQRDREGMDQRLKGLYFSEPCRFDGDYFRRRFRMRPHLFDKMMRSVANHDPYFVQNMDATGRLSLSTEQKLTCAMRMLAYGLPADLTDEFLDIAESTALEVLDHFTRAIWAVYRKEYLRKPTAADLQRLTDKAADRGFPGMLGSLDCMHWQWKNCPTAYAGQFQGHKGKPTIILEAVASYDTWIWHAYFGLPGSLNDLNVLGRSPLFDEVCRGEAPQVTFKVANSTYNQGYYLVDGIYPNWATLVKAIKNPTTPATRHFTRMQEAFRKDVERAFGILQARFAIVRGPARLWSRESLQYIMMTCIILHNMIVEDERDEDEQYEFDEDDIPTRPRRAEIYERKSYDHEVERDPGEMRAFVRDRYQKVRCPVISASLRSDLVEHGWALKKWRERI